MVSKCESIGSAHAMIAIGYSLIKRKNVKENSLNELKPNENVLFLRSDNINTDGLFDDPTPSYVYHEMKRRQEVAGFRRKDGFFRIEINPSKEEWRSLLGFDIVPGHLTEEQKEKVLKIANKLVDEFIEKMDSTDHWGYRHNSKGEKYSCITGKHTNLADSQSVWAVHFDTDDLHIHGVANVVTEHNQIQDTFMCRDRGFIAGDKVAEKYGWKTLDQYPNQRKERIHTDGIDVLKNMETFSLQKYFAEMMAKGWIVEPNSPDRDGKIHGYSVGEVMKHNDGSLSSVVRFKSSQLGHSKDLTPSNIYNTWRKLHSEAQQNLTPRESTRRIEQPKQQPVTIIPIRHRWDDDDRRKQEEERKAREARQKEAEARRAEQQRSHTPSPEEREARSAVAKAVSILKDFVNGTFNVFDQNDKVDLQEGIVGKCMLGGRDSDDTGNLKEAVNELMGMVEGAAELVNEATAQMIEIIADMAFPQIVSSSGGGGSHSGGWRGKKDDDDWNRWKPFFAAFRSRSKALK